MNARENPTDVVALRGESWLGGSALDLRLAARTLRRAPGFSLVTIATLGLGLALAASTLAVVNAYVIASLPYPAAERLYHVMYAPPGPVEPGGMSRLDWSSLGDVVEFPITATGETFYLTDGGFTQTVRGLRAGAGFLDGLGVRAVLGRPLRSHDFDPGAERVALIGHAVWRDRFGSDPGVVGRFLRADPEAQDGPTETFRIVGVLPAGFWYGRDSRETVDVLVPLAEPARTYMVRLAPGTSAAAAEWRITEAARSVATSLPPDWDGIRLESAHARYIAGVLPILTAVGVATGLVLVIVCANLAVLLLLRALRRQKEMGVRVALGAGRQHILRMVLVENSLLCAAALTLGLTLTTFTLRLLAPLIEAQLGRPAPGGTTALAVDRTVLLFVLGAGLLVALSLSWLPLLTPWQSRLAETLRRVGRGVTDGPGMRRTRSALIAFEVAGSLALLVSCGLMIRSAVNLLRTDLGFETRNVVRARLVLPGRSYADTPALVGVYERLMASFSPPANARVALTEAWPPFIEKPAQLIAAETGALDGGAATFLAVGPDYFVTLGMDLRRGRAFTAADRFGSEAVAIVSESLARRLWPDGGALGRRLRSTDESSADSPLAEWRTVVGVVGDVRQTYSDADLADVYVPFLQAPGRFAPLYVRFDGARALWLDDLRAAAARIDPYIVVHAPRPLADEDRQRASTGFLTSLLAGFACFALFLALLGIYGVTAYVTQHREREVAIRVAVGATRRAVITLFLRDGLPVIAAGVGGGLVAAAAIGRTLQHQLHGIQPFDAWTFVTASFVLILAGLAATWRPARRAASRSPLETLHEN